MRVHSGRSSREARVLQTGVDTEANARARCVLMTRSRAARSPTRSGGRGRGRRGRAPGGRPSRRRRRAYAWMRSTISPGRPPRLLARRLAGSCPIAAARRANSASSLPQHTVCATVVRSVAGSRSAASHARAHALHRVAEELDRRERQVELRRVLRREPRRALLAPTADDHRHRLLHRFRERRRVGDRVVLARCTRSARRPVSTTGR